MSRIGGSERLALVALALDDPGAAPGPRPTLEELWDWMGDEVEAGRADEIRAHVARDPEVCELWRQLRLALLEERVGATVPSGELRATRTASTTGGWLSRWRTRLEPLPFGGALATAVVLVTAISVALEPVPPSFDLWQDWQLPKGTRSVAADALERAELDAFLVGMGRQMSALSIAPDGPDEPDLAWRCGCGPRSNMARAPPTAPPRSPKSTLPSYG